MMLTSDPLESAGLRRYINDSSLQEDITNTTNSILYGVNRSNYLL